MEHSGHETSSLRCIVYRSTAKEAWPEHALDTLVERARTKNSNQGITGTLFYLDQHFSQVLEGPPDAVEGLYGTILNDPRHYAPQLILRRDITSRAFPGVAMARAGTKTTNLAAAVDAVLATLAPVDLSLFEDDVPSAPSNPAAPAGGTQLRLPPQQQRGHETVERIFAATRRLVKNRGFAPVGVPEIAETAGVTRATFYRYFTDTDGVIRTGLRRRMAQRMADWGAVLQQTHFTSDSHLAEMIAALGTQNLLSIRGVPPKLLAAALPYIEAELGALTRTFATDVLQAMQRCHLPGTDRIDPDTMALLLYGLAGVAMSAARQNLASLRSDSTRRLLAGMFLGGLRAAAQRSS